MFLLLQMSEQPAPSPLAVPSTSHNQNYRETPSPTSVQTGGSSTHTSVLGYTLHPMRVYDANKVDVKDVDLRLH